MRKSSGLWRAVRQSLDSIINIVAKTLEAQKGLNPRLNPQAAAKALIHALFQIKVTYRKVAEAEASGRRPQLTEVSPALAKSANYLLTARNEKIVQKA